MTLDYYAALSRKRRAAMGLPPWGEPPEPAAVVFDPPLTAAESEAYWEAISDESKPKDGES
jgi:hypothetical protein